jgi:hypothetical protein
MDRAGFGGKGPAKPRPYCPEPANVSDRGALTRRFQGKGKLLGFIRDLICAATAARLTTPFLFLRRKARNFLHTGFLVLSFRCALFFSYFQPTATLKTKKTPTKKAFPTPQ